MKETPIFACGTQQILLRDCRRAGEQVGQLLICGYTCEGASSKGLSLFMPRLIICLIQLVHWKIEMKVNVRLAAIAMIVGLSAPRILAQSSGKALYARKRGVPRSGWQDKHASRAGNEGIVVVLDHAPYFKNSQSGLGIGGFGLLQILSDAVD